MSPKKRAGLLVTVLAMLSIVLSPAQAAMQSTSDALGVTDRAQLTRMLKRDEVQQQLIEMGVDPKDALSRVENMTDEEVALMNEKIAELPAGAGVSTVELLLIIILILIVV